VLAVLLLGTLNARLVWENIFKYGLLIDFTVLFQVARDPYHWPCVRTMSSLSVNIVLALLVERGLAKGALSAALGALAHALNIAWVMCFPIWVIYRYEPHPAAALVLMTASTILVLKLTSFSVANRALKRALGQGAKKKDSKEADDRVPVDTKSLSVTGEVASEADTAKPDVPLEKQDPIAYPDNLTLKNIFYFIAAPTLVYEPQYPRVAHISKRRLMVLGTQMLCLTALQVGFTQQYVYPLAINAIKPIQVWKLRKNKKFIIYIKKNNRIKE
jgi:diacylglycerol O-acyltransferase 1